MKAKGLVLACVTVFLFLAGCGSMGTDFDASQVQNINAGTTTKADIESMFGKPFKTGIQNGHPVWVYERSRYSAVGSDTSKSLIVEFDNNGVVQKYQVLSNE